MLTKISETPFFNQFPVKCAYCHATGEMFDKTCPFCDGTGELIRQSEGVVRIFKLENNDTTFKD